LKAALLLPLFGKGWGEKGIQMEHCLCPKTTKKAQSQVSGKEACYLSHEGVKALLD